METSASKSISTYRGSTTAAALRAAVAEMERVAVENMMRIKKLMALERGSGAMMASARALGTGTTGYLFSFPATLFLVQSYWLYVVETRGAILSVPGPRATSRNILWSTTKVNEACARPPHVA